MYASHVNMHFESIFVSSREQMRQPRTISLARGTARHLRVTQKQTENITAFGGLLDAALCTKKQEKTSSKWLVVRCRTRGPRRRRRSARRRQLSPSRWRTRASASEAAADLREEHVRLREGLAPDINIDLMLLSVKMSTTLQMATNLAGHHLTDDHDEKALGASSAINKRASSPPLRATYSP